MCPLLGEYHGKGWLGQKSGKGFYEYKGKRWEKPSIPKEAGEKIDPLSIFAPAVNAAAWLVANNVASRDEVDKSVKLGLGFPKGIFELADEWGIDSVVRILREKEERYGEYYKPNPLITAMPDEGRLGVKSGRGFYEYESQEREFREILLKREPPLAWIVLNRPHRLNAINAGMIEELGAAVDMLWNSDERVILICGAGDRAFSAGADVATFTTLKPDTAFEFVRRFQETLSKLEKIPKPVIAAIDGFALGGGCEIALACDLRIASKKSQLGQPEIKLGIIPGAGGTQRLTKIVGPSKAKELIMLGDSISAEAAHRIGLVNKVVSAERFEEEVKALAMKLAEGPPVALKMAKYAINFGAQIPLDAGTMLEASHFGVLFGTKDVTEGVTAFLNKKKPKFKGE